MRYHVIYSVFFIIMYVARGSWQDFVDDNDSLRGQKMKINSMGTLDNEFIMKGSDNLMKNGKRSLETALGTNHPVWQVQESPEASISSQLSSVNHPFLPKNPKNTRQQNEDVKQQRMQRNQEKINKNGFSLPQKIDNSLLASKILEGPYILDYYIPGQTLHLRTKWKRGLQLIPVSRNLYILKEELYNPEQSFPEDKNEDKTSAMLSFKAHMHHNVGDIGNNFRRKVTKNIRTLANPDDSTNLPENFITSNPSICGENRNPLPGYLQDNPANYPSANSFSNDPSVSKEIGMYGDNIPVSNPNLRAPQFYSESPYQDKNSGLQNSMNNPVINIRANSQNSPAYQSSGQVSMQQNPWMQFSGNPNAIASPVDQNELNNFERGIREEAAETGSYRLKYLDRYAKALSSMNADDIKNEAYYLRSNEDQNFGIQTPYREDLESLNDFGQVLSTSVDNLINPREISSLKDGQMESPDVSSNVGNELLDWNIPETVLNSASSISSANSDDDAASDDLQPGNGKVNSFAAIIEPLTAQLQKLLSTIKLLNENLIREQNGKPVDDEEATDMNVISYSDKPRIKRDRNEPTDDYFEPEEIDKKRNKREFLEYSEAEDDSKPEKAEEKDEAEISVTKKFDKRNSVRLGRKLQSILGYEDDSQAVDTVESNKMDNYDDLTIPNNDLFNEMLLTPVEEMTTDSSESFSENSFELSTTEFHKESNAVSEGNQEVTAYYNILNMFPDNSEETMPTEETTEIDVNYTETGDEKDISDISSIEKSETTKEISSIEDSTTETQTEQPTTEIPTEISFLQTTTAETTETFQQESSVTESITEATTISTTISEESTAAYSEETEEYLTEASLPEEYNTEFTSTMLNTMLTTISTEIMETEAVDTSSAETFKISSEATGISEEITSGETVVTESDTDITVEEETEFLHETETPESTKNVCTTEIVSTESMEMITEDSTSEETSEITSEETSEIVMLPSTETSEGSEATNTDISTIISESTEEITSTSTTEATTVKNLTTKSDFQEELELEIASQNEEEMESETTTKTEDITSTERTKEPIEEDEELETEIVPHKDYEENNYEEEYKEEYPEVATQSWIDYEEGTTKGVNETTTEAVTTKEKEEETVSQISKGMSSTFVESTGVQAETTTMLKTLTSTSVLVEDIGTESTMKSTTLGVTKLKGETTTEDFKTDESMTEKSTTEELTTEESTTEESTTEELTTEELTTEESTTEESTTEELTTENSTTEELATEESTTEESTTEELTTEELTTEESTTEESTTEESTTENSTTEELATEESTTEELTTEKSTTEESTTEDLTTEESTTEALTTEESTTDELTTEESTTEELTTEETTTKESTIEESTTEESTTEELTTEESTTEELTTDQFTTTEIKTEESTTAKISTNEFTTDDFTTEQLITEDLPKFSILTETYQETTMPILTKPSIITLDDPLATLTTESFTVTPMIPLTTKDFTITKSTTEQKIEDKEAEYELYTEVYSEIEEEPEDMYYDVDYEEEEPTTDEWFDYEEEETESWETEEIPTTEQSLENTTEDTEVSQTTETSESSEGNEEIAMKRTTEEEIRSTEEIQFTTTSLPYLDDETTYLQQFKSSKSETTTEFDYVVTLPTFLERPEDISSTDFEETTLSELHETSILIESSAGNSEEISEVSLSTETNEMKTISTISAIATSLITELIGTEFIASSSIAEQTDAKNKDENETMAKVEILSTEAIVNTETMNDVEMKEKELREKEEKQMKKRKELEERLKELEKREKDLIDREIALKKKREEWYEEKERREIERRRMEEERREKKTTTRTTIVTTQEITTEEIVSTPEKMKTTTEEITTIDSMRMQELENTKQKQEKLEDELKKMENELNKKEMELEEKEEHLKLMEAEHEKEKEDFEMEWERLRQHDIEEKEREIEENEKMLDEEEKKFQEDILRSTETTTFFTTTIEETTTLASTEEPVLTTNLKNVKTTINKPLIQLNEPTPVPPIEETSFSSTSIKSTIEKTDEKNKKKEETKNHTNHKKKKKEREEWEDQSEDDDEAESDDEKFGDQILDEDEKGWKKKKPEDYDDEIDEEEYEEYCDHEVQVTKPGINNVTPKVKIIEDDDLDSDEFEDSKEEIGDAESQFETLEGVTKKVCLHVLRNDSILPKSGKDSEDSVTEVVCLPYDPEEHNERRRHSQGRIARKLMNHKDKKSTEFESEDISQDYQENCQLQRQEKHQTRGEGNDISYEEEDEGIFAKPDENNDEEDEGIFAKPNENNDGQDEEVKDEEMNDEERNDDQEEDYGEVEYVTDEEIAAEKPEDDEEYYYEEDDPEKDEKEVKWQNYDQEEEEEEMPNSVTDKSNKETAMARRKSSKTWKKSSSKKKKQHLDKKSREKNVKNDLNGPKKKVNMSEEVLKLKLLKKATSESPRILKKRKILESDDYNAESWPTESKNRYYVDERKRWADDLDSGVLEDDEDTIETSSLLNKVINMINPKDESKEVTKNEIVETKDRLKEEKPRSLLDKVKEIIGNAIGYGKTTTISPNNTNISSTTPGITQTPLKTEETKSSSMKIEKKHESTVQSTEKTKLTTKKQINIDEKKKQSIHHEEHILHRVDNPKIAKASKNHEKKYHKDVTSLESSKKDSKVNIEGKIFSNNYKFKEKELLESTILPSNFILPQEIENSDPKTSEMINPFENPVEEKQLLFGSGEKTLNASSIIKKVRDLVKKQHLGEIEKIIVYVDKNEEKHNYEEITRSSIDFTPITLSRKMLKRSKSNDLINQRLDHNKFPHDEQNHSNQLEIEKLSFDGVSLDEIVSRVADEILKNAVKPETDFQDLDPQIKVKIVQQVASGTEMPHEETRTEFFLDSLGQPISIESSFEKRRNKYENHESLRNIERSPRLIAKSSKRRMNLPENSKKKRRNWLKKVKREEERNLDIIRHRLLREISRKMENKHKHGRQKNSRYRRSFPDPEKNRSSKVVKRSRLDHDINERIRIIYAMRHGNENEKNCKGKSCSLIDSRSSGSLQNHNERPEKLKVKREDHSSSEVEEMAEKILHFASNFDSRHRNTKKVREVSENDLEDLVDKFGNDELGLTNENDRKSLAALVNEIINVQKNVNETLQIIHKGLGNKRTTIAPEKSRKYSSSTKKIGKKKSSDKKLRNDSKKKSNKSSQSKPNSQKKNDKPTEKLKKMKKTFKHHPVTDKTIKTLNSTNKKKLNETSNPERHLDEVGEEIREILTEESDDNSKERNKKRLETKPNSNTINTNTNFTNNSSKNHDTSTNSSGKIRSSLGNRRRRKEEAIPKTSTSHFSVRRKLYSNSPASLQKQSKVNKIAKKKESKRHSSSSKKETINQNHADDKKSRTTKKRRFRGIQDQLQSETSLQNDAKISKVTEVTNYSENQQATANLTNCQNCICDVEEVVEELKKLLLRKGNLFMKIMDYECARFEDIGNEIVLSSTGIIGDVLPRSRRDLTEAKGMKYVKPEELEDVLKGEETDGINERDVLSFPGTDLNIPCSHEGEDITWLTSISKPNYSWAREDGFPVTGLVKMSGNLELYDVDAKDTGNYTCSVNYVDPDNEETIKNSYIHRIQVVTLPRYTLRGGNRYKLENCDEMELYVLASHLPKKLNDLLCKGSVCDAFIYAPHCYHQQISIRILIIPSSTAKLFPIGPSQCGIRCRKAVQDKVALILSRNLRNILRKPIVFRLPHRSLDKLVPIDRNPQISRTKRGRSNNNEAEVDGQVGLLVGCPAGYGLRDSHCLPCEPGTYSDNLGSRCKTCPPGSHQPNTGARTCRSCTNPFVEGCYQMLWNSSSAVMTIIASLCAILTIFMIVIWMLCCGKGRKSSSDDSCARSTELEFKFQAGNDNRSARQPLIEQSRDFTDEEDRWCDCERVKKKRKRFLRRKIHSQGEDEQEMISHMPVERRLRSGRDHLEPKFDRIRTVPISCIDSYRSHGVGNLRNYFPRKHTYGKPPVPFPDFPR